MTKQELKEMLEKQLRLLSERLEKAETADDLYKIQGCIQSTVYMLVEQTKLLTE